MRSNVPTRPCPVRTAPTTAESVMNRPILSLKRGTYSLSTAVGLVIASGSRGDNGIRVGVSELPPGAKFCLECGHRVTAPDATSPVLVTTLPARGLPSTAAMHNP